MEVNQDTTQDLRKCTAAIQRSTDSRVFVTGVIVANDGRLVVAATR